MTHLHLTRRLAVGLVATVLGSGALAACGSSDDSSKSTTSSNGAATKPAGKKIKVGLVTDIGGLNDRSFNALANKGLMDAESQLGIDGRVLTSKSNADYVPNLSALAQQGDNLVIGVGFLMQDAVEQVANKFPNVKFAIIDVDQSQMKTKPKNVLGLLIKEQEAGYLAGYLAGLYAKDAKATTISSVGGQKIPPVDHYIAGYQAGAAAADPGIKTLNGYSQDFVDQAKCKEIALNQISQGSKVVFQVAGQCGLGALDAAKEKGVQGIGVDADQGYLGTSIITSAEKKVDVAVLTAIKQAQAGTLKTGTNQVFDIQNSGVGLGKLSSAGEPYQAKVAAIRQKIASGAIVPPDTVK